MSHLLPSFATPYAMLSPSALRQFALTCLRANLTDQTPLPKLENLQKTERSPLEKALYLADGEIRDGVAILPIQGVIYHKATFINQLYAFYLGGTILEWLGPAFDLALADNSVKAVLFQVASPGGEAMGNSELAARIYAGRAQKPIWAHVEGGNFSAGYYLSSAAEKIYATQDSSHGSIGTVLSFYNFDKMLEKMGIEEIEIVSSVSPHKRPDETTDAGRAKYQEWVDALGNQFVDAVAKQRDVSRQTVLKDFGQGWIKTGFAAQKAGMIDGIASFDAVFSALAQGQKEPELQSPAGEKIMSALNKIIVPITMLLGGKAIESSVEIDEETANKLQEAAPDAPAATAPATAAPSAASQQPAAESEAMQGLRRKVAAAWAAPLAQKAVADQRDARLQALTDLHLKAQAAGFEADLEAAFEFDPAPEAAESKFGVALDASQIQGAQKIDTQAAQGDEPSAEQIAAYLGQTALGQQVLAHIKTAK